jgi:hypothetical protein
MQSHTKLRDQSNEILDKFEQIQIDNNIYENWLNDKELTYMMECKCNDITAARPARNVKWYQFLGIDGQIYIYLKLEDWGTIHPKHLGQAILKYGLNKSNTSCVRARREDCKHENDENKCKKESDCCTTGEHQWTGYKINDDEIRSIKDEETYGRVGDEVFIPSEINELLLNPNLSSIQISPSEDDENVIINTTIETDVGGKHMRKTRRKK